jgi:5-hydroxyisourate hydrolase-like protein (transthyretin family)
MEMDRRQLVCAGSSPLALTALIRRATAAGSPGLTTHMLDTASGKPAEGVKVDFSVLEGEVYRFIKTVHTNADGRNAEPLLTEGNMKVGQYQLVFHLAAYFAAA